MTPTERQRRWRAHRAGRAPPVNLARVRKVVDRAFARLAEPMGDEERDMQLWFWHREIQKALDGEPASGM
jgi:hypothetical protein